MLFRGIRPGLLSLQATFAAAQQLELRLLLPGALVPFSTARTESSQNMAGLSPESHSREQSGYRPIGLRQKPVRMLRMRQACTTT